MGKISELFAEIGFKIDTIKLREVTKIIGDLNISSIISAGSVVGLGVAIKGLVDETAQASIGLATLRANTGIDTTFAQQFEKASYALGASKEGADALITSLSQIRTDISLGKGLPPQLAMMGYSIKDFSGTLEEQIKKINSILSKPVGARSHAEQEHWAGFMSYINRAFGGAEMLKVLETPDLFKRMSGFLTLTPMEITESNQATYEWRKTVEDINTEFQKMATKLLPDITHLLHDFDAGGGLKALMWTVDHIVIGLEKMGDLLQIAKNYTRAGILNDNVKEKMAEREYGKEIKNINLTVHATMNVAAKDITDFEKKTEEWFKKLLANATRQFGLGST